MRRARVQRSFGDAITNNFFSLFISYSTMSTKDYYFLLLLLLHLIRLQRATFLFY